MRESVEENVEAAAALRGWLMTPRSDTGVYLATDDGRWQFTPYAVLANHALRIAQALRGEDVTSGVTVAVLMPTSRLCLATMFGVLACGGTLTPITPPQFDDPDRYAERLRGIMTTSGAAVLVCAPMFVDLAAKALAPLDSPPPILSLGDAPECDALDELVEPGPFALLQMTSGSTGFPRGVQVSWRNLVANIDAMHAVCETRPDERGASWLPLYHDMGLVSGVFMLIPRQHEIRLLRPDQFIRDPLLWLQASALAEHTVSPSFGLDYASRRLTPADLGDLDLSGLRTLVIAADRINPDHLNAFAELTAGHGFSPSAFVPSYGLAEMTLIATGQHSGEPIWMTRVDRSALRSGQPVRVLDQATLGSAKESSSDWIVSVGHAVPGHGLRIADDSGVDLPEGSLGEIVLSGPSVAQGYRGDQANATRFDGGELHTGDAGFIIDRHVYVLGRMGTSLKVNVRSIFAEDLDVEVAAAMGLRPGRLVAVAVNETALPGVAVFVEESSRPTTPAMITSGLAVLNAYVGDDSPLWLIKVPRGGLLRTTSGKPRRSYMWQQWKSGELSDAELLFQRGDV